MKGDGTNMLLVVKLPKDKPPFIGIKFEHEFEAEKTNADLIDLYGDKPFRAVLELRQHLGIVKLFSEHYKIVKTYQYVGYEDVEKLRMWLKIIIHTPPKIFNFGHIISNGHDKLVKTFATRRNFVLQVHSCQLQEIDEL